MFGTTEIIIIMVAVMVLFGSSKIPEFGKAIGQSFKGFKDGMKGIDEEKKKINDEVNKK